MNALYSRVKDAKKIFEINSLDTDNYGNADTIQFGLPYISQVQNNLIIYGDMMTTTT